MDARFAFSCRTAKDLPPPALPELAVAGRSNCGKSSLINAITGQPKLARTSSTPGRTQQIIIFEVRTLATADPAQTFHLVDLPGYGYAKASRAAQRAWGRLVTWYIGNRPNLVGLLLLGDIRRAMEDAERDLLRWTATREIPVQVVLTKSDKLNKSQRFAAAEAAKRALGLGHRPPTVSIHDPEAVGKVRRLLLGMLPVSYSSGR